MKEVFARYDRQCILALDIYRSEFDSLLKNVVLTFPDSASYTAEQRERAFAKTTVYCQWDFDRSVNGNAIDSAAMVENGRKLKENGIHLHPAMEQAFIKLYGYTSDEDGIRHGELTLIMFRLKMQNICWFRVRRL